MAHNDDINILAKTLYGEARGEGNMGIEAVACVVMNRVAYSKKRGGKYWWGSTPKEVCLKKYQFSCWNDGDPNRRLLERDMSGDIVYGLCERIATKAVNGMLADITDGATHYLTEQGIKAASWDDRHTQHMKIGKHYFYKDIG